MATLIYKDLFPQVSPGVDQLLQLFVELVQDPSCVFKMAEIARTLGVKRMCRMEVDYLGLEVFDVFCVEHEVVLTALMPIQSMVSEATIEILLGLFKILHAKSFSDSLPYLIP